MAIMPTRARFDEVVAGEGALYANTNLQALGLKSGQKILIYGASGAIGTAAVQLAKFYGAEVTAVVATRHLDLAWSLGADHVIDYTTQDFSRIGETFDCVLDAVGKTSFFHCRRLLKPDGVFATTDPLGYRKLNLLPLIGRLVTRSGRFLFPLPKDRISFVQFLEPAWRRVNSTRSSIGSTLSERLLKPIATSRRTEDRHRRHRSSTTRRVADTTFRIQVSQVTITFPLACSSTRYWIALPFRPMGSSGR